MTLVHACSRSNTHMREREMSRRQTMRNRFLNGGIVSPPYLPCYFTLFRCPFAAVSCPPWLFSLSLRCWLYVLRLANPTPSEILLLCTGIPISPLELRLGEEKEPGRQDDDITGSVLHKRLLQCRLAGGAHAYVALRLGKHGYRVRSGLVGAGCWVGHLPHRVEHNGSSHQGPSHSVQEPG